MFFFLLNDILAGDVPSRKTKASNSLTFSLSDCGSDGINSLSFDTEYTFQLTGCIVDNCYSIYDNTYRLGTYYLENLPASIVNSATLDGLDTNVWIHPGTISFKPQSIAVTLVITTKTANEFYTLHPFEEDETITEYNVTGILSGLYVCP